MSIPMTQFLLPHGRQVEVLIDRPEDVERMARDIIAAGFRFEVELLRNGLASVTIADPTEELDVDIELEDNGLEVPASVDKLVRRFHAKLAAVKP